MSDEPRWLLLIHQLAARPGYARVKAWRRLQRMGAVPVRGSVYVLPRTDACLEDFQWLSREITGEGGEATVCAATFVEGLADGDVENLFRTARDADYSALVEDARALRRRIGRRAKVEGGRDELAALRRRLAEIVAIDFFAAPGRAAVDEVLDAIEARLGTATPAPRRRKGGEFHARTWTTRKGIHIDRMACAWLIRRFVDADAKLRFVAKGDPPVAGELRYDMFEGEFTHEGDRCSFETIVHRFALDDAALAAIAEIVHDIDLKDDKYARPETAGIATLIAGIAMTADDDHDRLARASVVFDDLHAYFRKKSPAKRRR